MTLCVDFIVVHIEVLNITWSHFNGLPLRIEVVSSFHKNIKLLIIFYGSRSVFMN